ncbi:MAG TPA: DegQ family serine endoprotease [Candidatus Binatia bacterium]|jgi:serine protease Do
MRAFASSTRTSFALSSGTVGVAAGTLLGALAATWIGHPPFEPERPVPMYVSFQSRASADAPAPGSMGFASVFRHALPAVVSITTSQIVKVPEMQMVNPFFQQFFGGQPHGRGGRETPRQQRQSSLGSGVVVSPDGYILTNDHVVDEASDIKITLADKRQFTGKVVGADKATDIAVVKIPASGLPTATLGDSSKLQVGDYAFAVGNPFGVGETATMGIISATGRNGLDIEDYEDFIQTDAAINPGNSGGPLLNAAGELVGVNTAILSGATGGNQGIGFAIPINMAKYVMSEIIKRGKVVRGYLGVGIQEVTPDLAAAFKIPAETGALVGGVAADSPGARAGLERGDVITALDGTILTGPNDLRLRVGNMAPGTRVRLTVNHEGQSRDVAVTLGEAPAGNGPGNAQPQSGRNAGVLQGVEVEDLSRDIRGHLGIKADVKGVIVTDVEDETPAADAGLRRGDVIEQVNRQQVTSVADYTRRMKEAGNQQVVLLVNREGMSAFVVIQP